MCRVVALLFQLLAIMLNKVQRSNWPDYLMEGTPHCLQFPVWILGFGATAPDIEKNVLTAQGAPEQGERHSLCAQGS